MPISEQAAQQARRLLQPGNIIGYEQFHSLAALKATWELD